MAIITEVSLASLGSRVRLDAEYYQPVYLEREAFLGRHSCERLGRIALVTDGIHSSPIFESRSGIRYVSAKCVRRCLFDMSHAEEISASQHRVNPRTALRRNDVIISTVGTIGFCAVVDDRILPANCDRHVGIVRLFDPERYDPHYVAAFINSKHGRNQTVREATGNVQLNLFIYSIARLRVPFFAEQRRIGDLIRSGVDLHQQSEALYAAAADIFERELMIPHPDLSEELGYETTVGEMHRCQRWDAEFFKSKYRRVIAAVRSSPKVRDLVPVGRMLAYLTNGHTPRRHDLSSGDVPFLTAEHVADFRIDYGTEKRILPEHHRKLLARTQLKDGDLLVTIKGKVGNAAVAAKVPGDVNLNQDVALMRMREGVDPDFFAAWFNCKAGKQLSMQRSTGGINPFLGLGTLASAPFPLVDRDEQKRIGSMVRGAVGQANRAAQGSSAAIEEGIRLVEELVER